MITKSSIKKDCICLNDVNNPNVYLNMLRVINYILRTSMKSLFEQCQLSPIVIYACATGSLTLIISHVQGRAIHQSYVSKGRIINVRLKLKGVAHKSNCLFWLAKRIVPDRKHFEMRDSKRVKSL